MKTPSWQSGLSQSLAAQINRRQLSPKRTLLVAGAVLVLLYAGLLAALPADAAVPAVGASEATQPLPAQFQTQPTPVAPPDRETARDEAVSPGLLAEYDRLAAGSDPFDAEESPAAPTDQSNAISTIFAGLFLIVAAIYGGVWLYKRYGSGQGSGLAVGGQMLAVQESHAIGPHQKLHLVRVGDELLLIGATDQSISFLARYDGEVVGNTGFAGHLQNAMATEKSRGLDLSEGLQRLRNLSNSGFRGGSDD